MLNIETFIKRPVLATVISLLILVFGLHAWTKLPLRQFPEITSSVIQIVTLYPGADAELVQGYVTTPIERAVASADGVDYLSSSSKQGVSIIQVHLRLNFPPDRAFTDVSSKVASIQDQLPTASKAPIIKKVAGETMALMYLGFSSNSIEQLKITDFLSRVVRPRLETLDGVGRADILGGNRYAMRIWLNAKKMAALGVTPSDIALALQTMNVQTAAGKTKSTYLTYDIKANTDLHSVQEFEQLVVRRNDELVIRLRDVSTIELGAESYDSQVVFDDKKAVFIGLYPAPDANPLELSDRIRKVLPEITQAFPESLKGEIVYDGAKYIRSAIAEVKRTLIEATLIVICVIFLFLGTFRAVLIPVVTIPLSLVGVCLLMLMMGYSLNLLTLLAMVLAIGLVVDDAIVVVENIHRHIEQDGLTPLQAALKGSHEIAMPVISMTFTLAAVYAPIGFTSGLTGALFKEFAFTLAASVIISGIVALTLSPMLCSRLLTAEHSESWLVKGLNHFFNRVSHAYERRLHRNLERYQINLVFAMVILASCYFLYAGSRHELAPPEDQNFLFVLGKGPQNANRDYMSAYLDQIQKVYHSIPEVGDYFAVIGFDGPSSLISGALLKPWEERSKTQQALEPIFKEKLHQIAGLDLISFSQPTLPGADGLPVQFVLTSMGNYSFLYLAAKHIEKIAEDNHMFLFSDIDLAFNQPQVHVDVQRTKSALLGTNMKTISTDLAVAFGGNELGRFSMQGQSYGVIPQLLRKDRFDPEDIGRLYLRASNGIMVPLSTIADISITTVPNLLPRFQQLNSVTISAVAMPGKSLSEVLTFLSDVANQLYPKVIQQDYSGMSRQYYQEGNAFLFALMMAIIVIYLLLAAQYESFRDPLIILITVPLSISGALLPLFWGLNTINIYTQIGLITLVGLISKHGILMVDFANHLQRTEKLTRRQAIEKAASIRLRPILMTTAAMICGVMPLLMAFGAGAGSRYALGLVITFGMSIGTLFTLFMVPSLYCAIAKDHTHE